MFKTCPPIISDHPESTVFEYKAPILKGYPVICTVVIKGKNHIEPANHAPNFKFKILDLKYINQIDKVYPANPPVIQTNKVIIFIKNGKKINSGVGKINQLNILPPKTVIKASPDIPTIITQEESFKE